MPTTKHENCSPDSTHMQIIDFLKSEYRFTAKEAVEVFDIKNVNSFRTHLQMARNHLVANGDPGFIQHPDDDGNYTYVINRLTVDAARVGRGRRGSNIMGRMAQLESDMNREADIEIGNGRKQLALNYRRGARSVRDVMDTLELL